jgi:ATP-dependent exoDNAse (exonuclease V) alpha subunit
MSAAVEPEIDPSDEEIDALVAEFKGDFRQVIRALLHDMTELARDSEAAVSRGYVRGRLLPFTARRIGNESKP